MASEISPSQKDRSCVAPLRGGPESSPVPRDGQERGVARGRGRGEGEVSIEGVQSSGFGGTVAQHCGHAECH